MEVHPFEKRFLNTDGTNPLRDTLYDKVATGLNAEYIDVEYKYPILKEYYMYNENISQCSAYYTAFTCPTLKNIVLKYLHSELTDRFLKVRYDIWLINKQYSMLNEFLQLPKELTTTLFKETREQYFSCHTHFKDIYKIAETLSFRIKKNKTQH